MIYWHNRLPLNPELIVEKNAFNKNSYHLQNIFLVHLFLQLNQLYTLSKALKVNSDPFIMSKD